MWQETWHLLSQPFLFGAASDALERVFGDVRIDTVIICSTDNVFDITPLH